MADYPRYWILDTTPEPSVFDGFEPRRASNGALKVRKLSAGEKREFAPEHFLTAAEKSALWSFYQTNKLLDVTLYWPGEASPITVRFVAAPQFRGPSGTHTYTARVRLAEV